MGEDTRRRAAEDDAALEAARERERAGRRTYRLVYGGRFGAWPVLSGRDLRSAPLTDLREGDGAVAPGGAATPRGGWVHVVACVEINQCGGCVVWCGGRRERAVKF